MEFEKHTNEPQVKQESAVLEKDLRNCTNSTYNLAQIFQILRFKLNAKRHHENPEI